MLSTILISWIGKADLLGSKDNPGPNRRLLNSDVGPFDQVYFLNDFPNDQGDIRTPRQFVDWLSQCTSYPGDKFQIIEAGRSLENQLSELFRFAHDNVFELRKSHPNSKFVFHLSPGYGLSKAALIVSAGILFDDRRDIEFFNTSREKGVEVVEIPFDLSLTRIIQQAVEDSDRLHSFEDMTCHSIKMKEAVNRLQRIAPTPFNILLRGERGTGKTEFAKKIHLVSSVKRNDESGFTSVNCATIHGDTAVAELFGAEDGSFTGQRKGKIKGLVAEANKGTLFLDEIGQMDLPLQAKLLTFVETGKYRPMGGSEQNSDVRIIAATNLNIEDAIKEGRFLPDLYDRLRDFEIVIPPLRDRPADFKEIAQNVFNHVVKDSRIKNMSKTEAPIRRLSEDAIVALKRFEWCGNIRELKKALIQLFVLTDSETITSEDVVSLLGSGHEIGLPLSKLSGPSFFNHFVAVIEELIDRFDRNDGSLPIEKKDKYDLFDDIIHPVAIGRSHYLGGVPNKNKTDNSRRLKPTRIEFTKGKGVSINDYDKFLQEGLINEEIIREIRDADVDEQPEESG